MGLPEKQEASPMCEKDLIALAQAGDDRAFTMLVALCEPMLRAQVAHFRLPHIEEEDMAQEGLLGLLAAVRSFDPQQGASFRTYASVCVRNRLLSLLRGRVAQAQEVPMEDVTTMAEGEQSTVLTDPASLLVERESAEHILLRMRKVLSAREYAVMTRYLDGLPYAAIASQLQLSPKAVDNALQRARVKLQQLF